MDNSTQQPMDRQTDHLGVNKMGKNIKKSPLHQPNFSNAARQQAQPHVYNINKNDFRNIVQQLTGSPSREPPPRPPQNHPKPPNNRLMRIRPPPLAPNRPQVPIHPIPQAHYSSVPPPPPYPNNIARPPPPSRYDQASPNASMPLTPIDVWANTTESPISAYMRYLQNSVIASGPQSQPPVLSGQNLSQPQFLPNPVMPQLTSPQMNGTPPRFLASPHVNAPSPPLPSPRMNAFPSLLPSPTSQFLLPSPSGFFNLLSPRSPYPFSSPGYQHLPPISPNFAFSSAGQLGILGPGPHPPPSPGYGFPLSPSGFFAVSSPRWRDQ